MSVVVSRSAVEELLAVMDAARTSVKNIQFAMTTGTPQKKLEPMITDLRTNIIAAHTWAVAQDLKFRREAGRPARPRT